MDHIKKTDDIRRRLSKNPKAFQENLEASTHYYQSQRLKEISKNPKKTMGPNNKKFVKLVENGLVVNLINDPI